jgi:N6-L-threonylcarbamoyladenine synthase
MTRILGIETSCDETAAAVVEDRTRVLSNVVASSVELHRKYGGVVPEIASRHQAEVIGAVVSEALEASGAGLDRIDAVAVTYGPGLVGSLLVGVSTAKALAWQRGLPLVAVNHLEGHVLSPFIEHEEIELPFLALVVSGGHTQLYLCRGEGSYETIARTRDDAAGEAFDKVAKLLGLGYPGGPVIDRLARDADEDAIEFPLAVMKDRSLDFSFSGLKTAVRTHVRERGLGHDLPVGGEAPAEVRDLVASFQKAAVQQLMHRTLKACRQHGIDRVLVSGGVACNGRLRAALADAEAEHGIRVHLPSPVYTTDNAAMIASAAFAHLAAGRIAPAALNAQAGLKL